MPSRYHHFEILLRADGTPWELGHSAMGVTYRARDMNLKTEVALKVIPSFRDFTTRERFWDEARAAASLRHPNVASIFHLGEQDGECFYAVELVNGQTLEERMRKSGKIPVREALEITLQVARALGAMEQSGVVHHNIKPENFMLARDDDGDTIVKVIDFGFEQHAAPHYVSPEQIQGGLADGRSDIYSLGVTLYFMLAGQLPFSGTPAQLLVAHLQLMPPSTPLQTLPPEVRALVLRMLIKDPALRPQSAADVRRGIEACLQTLPHVATPPALPSVMRDNRKFVPFLVTATAIFVLFIAGAATTFIFLPLFEKARSPVGDRTSKAFVSPVHETFESLMTDAAALQAKDHYAPALTAYARIADQFPKEKAPLDLMEMISAFLRSNAFVMTAAEFDVLRPALETAAARNVVSAQVLLGEQLRNSDPAESFKWFKAAAKNGQTEAMTQAGLMLSNGRGTSTPDMRLALGWFEQAAAAGDSDAMTALAECYIFGKGTAKNPKRAAELLQAATALNHVRALNLLGDLYSRGIGVPQNFSEAFRLFTRASELGSGEAMANLGVLYMHGQGVPIDTTKAISIWKTGAERGFPACMLNYAKALEAGTDAQSSSEARRWYLEAARSGNADALTWCRKNGIAPDK